MAAMLDTWMVVIASSFEVNEFLHKMAISLNNCRVEQKNHSFLANWSDWALSFQHLLRFEVDLSPHLTLGSTAPFGQPSASPEFFHSLILPHYQSASLPTAVQNTTPEGVLSKCWCSPTLTLTTSIGIWQGAGVTKSWLQSPGRSKSFAGNKNSLNSNELFYLDAKRNVQRWQSNTNWGHKKSKSWCVKGYGATKCPSLVVLLSCSSRISLIYRRQPLKSVCFSVSLCESWLWLFLIRCSKLKNSSAKWQSPFQIWGVEQQNHSFLANWTDWALSSHYLMWLEGILSVHLAIRSTAPSGRPSASF